LQFDIEFKNRGLDIDLLMNNNENYRFDMINCFKTNVKVKKSKGHEACYAMHVRYDLLLHQDKLASLFDCISFYALLHLHFFVRKDKVHPAFDYRNQNKYGD
jgi:hypothetical protein